MSPDDGMTASEGTAAVRPAEPLPSDPAELEAMIARRRADLAVTIDQLVVRAHPREIARRSAADARSRLRSLVSTEEGELRVERLAAVAAAGVSLLGLLLVVRRRSRRSS